MASAAPRRAQATCARLSEDVLDAVEQPLVVLLVGRRRLEFLFRHGRGELLEQFLLLARELLRRRQLHADDQVPPPSPRHVGHPAATQRERGAALRAFRNRVGFLALERRDLDIAAQREGRVVQGDLAEQIVAVALKERMVLDVDDDVQVAGRSSRGPCFALPAETQALSGGDARGDAHRDLAFLRDAARAAAFRARLADDRAGATALPAGAGDGKEALLVAKLAAALALRAGGRLGAGRRAAAFAGLAQLLPWNLDGGLRAFGGFLEGDFKVVSKVGAALWSRPPLLPACAKHGTEAEDVAEAAQDVFEAGEDARIEAGAAAEPGVAETVVHAPLVGIGQDGIRLGRFLELVLCVLVAVIAVGVI